MLTLFPEMFPSYLGQSLLNRAVQRGLIEVRLHNIRNWSRDKHQKVDDRPFGGGPGMVLMVEPVVACVEAVQAQAQPPGHLVLFTPQGRRLTQAVVEELAARPRLVLLCGRYEGFDQRVCDLLHPDEISIGDYVLGGGELPALVLIDAVARLVPGVLGDDESSRRDSFSGEGRLLEGSQYTRPREFRGLAVPEVLLGGNHQQIARWRAETGLARTRQRRSDLLADPADAASVEPAAAPSGPPADERQTP